MAITVKGVYHNLPGQDPDLLEVVYTDGEEEDYPTGEVDGNGDPVVETRLVEKSITGWKSAIESKATDEEKRAYVFSLIPANRASEKTALELGF